MSVLPHDIKDAAAQAARALENGLGGTPRIAAVLGTGFEALSEPHSTIATMPFDAVPGLSKVSAPGHAGTISLVETEGGEVLVQSGRLHCYEGYTSLEASFPVWAYGEMGIETVVLTAAVGGLNPVYTPGDLVILADHIFLWGENPLTGLSPAEGRDIYLPAADHYSEPWRERVKMCLPPTVPSELATYAYSRGPSFESAAEATLLRIAGADVVGMSIPVETIAARYLGMNVAALCCVSNVLIPIRTAELNPESILGHVRGTVSLLDGFLGRLASAPDMIM